MSREKLIDAVIYRDVKDNGVQGYFIDQVSANQLPMIFIKEPLIFEGVYVTHLTDGNILIIA